MVDTRLIKDDSGITDLCETFSTEGRMLRQVQTNTVYGSSVIDLISGYDENGKPYSRFTYEETEYLFEE